MYRALFCRLSSSIWTGLLASGDDTVMDGPKESVVTLAEEPTARDATWLPFCAHRDTVPDPAVMRVLAPPSMRLMKIALEMVVARPLGKPGPGAKAQS